MLFSTGGNNRNHSTTQVVLAFVSGAAFGSLALLYRQYKNRPPKEDPIIKAERQLWNIIEQSFTGTMIHIFDELRLYDLLWDNGPSTAAELAAITKWNERYLNEILCQAVSAGICVYFLGKFCIKPEYAHLLRDPNKSSKSMVGAIQLLHRCIARSDAVVNAVKTGKGFDYDYGPNISEAIDRKNGNFFKHKMIDEILAKVNTPKTSTKLIEKLEQGIVVADVGCGYGASTIAMAMKFPNSQFYAYESSQTSLLKLNERIEKAQLKNITIYNPSSRSIGQGVGDNGDKFDFIYTHDVIHDMVDPRGFIKEVKKVLKEDGCWIIVDVQCSESLKENLMAKRAPMLYGFSSLLCLPSALSSPAPTTKKGKIKVGCKGLGTCGFPATLARRWLNEAGFPFFEEMEIESLPYNSCFIVG